MLLLLLVLSCIYSTFFFFFLLNLKSISTLHENLISHVKPTSTEMMKWSLCVTAIYIYIYGFFSISMQVSARVWHCDGSWRSVSIESSHSVEDLLLRLISTNHSIGDKSWSIVEHLPDLDLGRYHLHSTLIIIQSPPPTRNQQTLLYSYHL